jgi:hypothetical protein
MRVLNHTEIETVSGGTWWLWSWCKPKVSTCTPKTTTTCAPKPTVCEPVKPKCGPAPTPEIN